MSRSSELMDGSVRKVQEKKKSADVVGSEHLDSTFKLLAYSALAGAWMLNTSIFSALSAINNPTLNRGRLAGISLSSLMFFTLGGAFMFAAVNQYSLIKQKLQRATGSEVAVLKPLMAKAAALSVLTLIVASMINLDKKSLSQISIESAAGSLMAIMPVMMLWSYLHTGVTADVPERSAGPGVHR